MKGSKYNRVSVQFDYKVVKDGQGEAIVTKNSRTGASEFEFTFPLHYPTHRFMNQLDQFDTITYLDMTLTAKQDFHFNDVDKLDKAENLWSSIVIFEHILTKEVDCYKLKLLKNLTMVNVIITQGALKYLDKYAPSLKQMTLDSCDVAPDSDESFYDQVLNKLHTALFILLIIASADFSDEKDTTRINARWIHIAVPRFRYVSQIINLEITFLPSKRFPVQYFFFKAGELSSCERICKDGFQEQK